MKKKPIYLILGLLVIGTLIGVFYFNETRTPTIGTEKEVEINPVQNYKNNEAYVEQVVNSFFQVATNLVNSKSLDFSYLEEIVDKDSNAYEVVKEEFTSLRKIGEEIQIVITELNISQKSETLYEVAVTTDKIIPSATESKPNFEDLVLTVKVHDGYKIVEYIKK